MLSALSAGDQINTWGVWFCCRVPEVRCRNQHTPQNSRRLSYQPKQMIQNDVIDFELTTEQADFIHCSSENQEKCQLKKTCFLKKRVQVSSPAHLGLSRMEGPAGWPVLECGYSEIIQTWNIQIGCEGLCSLSVSHGMWGGGLFCSSLALLPVAAVINGCFTLFMVICEHHSSPLWLQARSASPWDRSRQSCGSFSCFQSVIVVVIQRNMKHMQRLSEVLCRLIAAFC